MTTYKHVFHVLFSCGTKLIFETRLRDRWLSTRGFICFRLCRLDKQLALGLHAIEPNGLELGMQDPRVRQETWMPAKHDPQPELGHKASARLPFGIAIPLIISLSFAAWVIVAFGIRALSWIFG